MAKRLVLSETMEELKRFSNCTHFSFIRKPSAGSIKRQKEKVFDFSIKEKGIEKENVSVLRIIIEYTL